MRKIVITVGILVSLATVKVVKGQAAEGVIAYEMKINLHRRIPPGQEQMKAMMPEFRTTREQLFFNAVESLNKPVIEDEEEDTMGGGGIQIKLKPNMDETYIKPAESTLVIKREFMGKEYLITDTLKVAPWRFGTETREILGYSCRQAYYTDESQPDRKLEITAWFTDKLRAMLGPQTFGTLPGAVLAVDVNNGERVIVAREIKLRPLKKSEMKVPHSGILVSQKEFRKIQDEQMEKMKANGGVIIRN